MVLHQLQLQKSLYQHLLSGHTRAEEDIELFLSKTLKLLVDFTGARIGCIHWKYNTSEQAFTVYTSSESGLQICENLSNFPLEPHISHGIIQDAMERKQLVVTTNASVDPLYSHRESVKREKIETVLCAPFGQGKMEGVIYLQGRETDSLNLQMESNLMSVNGFTQYVLPILEKWVANPPSNMEELRKKYALEDVLGESAGLYQVLEEAMNIASLEVTVLLTGASGTGKSQLAKKVHQNSHRSQGPFMAINCANLPEALLENELFGAMPGAHSGAQQRIVGKVSAAEGGTLFLDEVGELSLETQAKLLQLLEEGIYFPLGAHAPQMSNVRIIAATHVDLRKAVEDGRFREDLYYRLCVFPIEIPLLSQRKEDVKILAEAFCKKYGRKFELVHCGLTALAVQALQKKDWPGNIRELDHVVQQGVIRARIQGETQVGVEHLFPREFFQKAEKVVEASNFKQAREEWEKGFLEERLRSKEWNVSQVARDLGLSRSQLHHLIKERDITRIR